VRGSSAGLRSALCTQRSALSSAFTLIEIMVVVVIIVLMLGMAIPVFRVINGSRSEAGASNNIAAMLNRARTDAIGIQQPYGVAFLYNPVTQITEMAEVYFPPVQVWVAAGQNVGPGGYLSTTVSGLTYYFVNPVNNGTVVLSSGPSTTAPPVQPANLLPVNGPPLEIFPDTDLIPLPAGIGVQTICNCTLTGSTRNGNGYLSIGVIMFDGKGRIVSLPYGIAQYGKLGSATSLPYSYPNSGSIGTLNSSGNPISLGVRSQFGLVVYQNDAFQSHRSPTQPEALYTDQTTTSGILPHYTTGSPTQQQADLWLDQNATPLLINRYTGTLIKGE
jgi:type II secretory pathway pseudopilin PulG